MKKFYPIKVWCLTLLIAPIVYLVVQMIKSKELFFEGASYFIGFAFIIGGLLSFPTLLMFNYFSGRFAKLPWSLFTAKLLSASIACLGLIVTFLLLDGKGALNFGIGGSGDLLLCYAVSLIGATFLFRLRGRDEIPSSQV